MSNKNAIYQAARNSSTPTLPAGFLERFAARIEKQRRREEWLEKITYMVIGVVSLSLLTAIIVFCVRRLEIDWKMWELPKLELLSFSLAKWQSAKYWGAIAAFLCALLTLDCYIRHQIYLRQPKKEDENKNNS